MASSPRIPGSNKRKLVDEHRAFQEMWTEKYFFIYMNNKAFCLICNESVSVFKDFNLKRHYQTHASRFDNIKGEFRKQKILELKTKLSSQQQIFKKMSFQNISFLKASYVVANIIAKKSKPFSDGEFVKECLESVVDIICPEKKSEFSKISLSHQTVARCVNDLPRSIYETMKMRSANFKYFSLAIDESTDASDTAQLAIFIRGIEKDFNITEELASLVPLKDTTTSKDLFEAVKVTLEKLSLNFENMSGLTTDGAPAMIGKHGGLTKLLQREAITSGNKMLLTYHCIIHQENLCAKSLQMNEIMTIVIKIVNFIKSRALNHRQFQQFLIDLESEYGDLVYYSEIRWLSRGKMLKRVYELKEEITLFMENKGKIIPQLRDEIWLADLAFLVDITTHLNCLNLQLQGKNQFINNMFDLINAFEIKLTLWESQLKANNYAHFPTLSNHTDLDSEKYVNIIADLKIEFEKRFQDFREQEVYFKIFATPFSVDVNEIPSNLQLQCIELQSNMQMKEKFGLVNLLDFYKFYVSEEKYPELRQHGLYMCSIFGSTYICEQFFSRMKHTKSKSRTRITDEHLENSLRIATSSIEPNIDALVNEKQNQKSH